MKDLKLFLLLMPVFLVLDFAWLGVVMKNFYRTELGELARLRNGALAPNWLAAGLVYVLIVAGLVVFVLPRIEAGQGVARALLLGAGFGLVVYGVYDLTNYAVLSKWTLRMTIIDILWGCSVCGICAVVLQRLGTWLSQS